MTTKRGGRRLLDSPGQIAALIAAVGGILTAVVQWAKNRNDKKAGVASAQREDQAAWDARYQQVLDEVRQHLVGPLREEVARLREDVANLRADLATEREALREERARYRAALAHIRSLTAWISHHMPAGTPDPPDPPERITSDLH